MRVAFSRCISKERGLRTAEGQSGASFRPEKAVAAAFEAAWGALHRAGQIFSHAGAEETFGAKAADAAQNVWESGRTAAAGAAKKGFLHTVAGKVTAVLVSLAVVGGAAGTAYTVYSIGSRLDELPFRLGAEQSSAVSTAAPETSPAEPSPTPEAPQVREMAEADYPALIAGNLTKAEVEYVLAYGPEEITEQGLEQMDYVNALNTLCQGPEGSGMASTGQVNPIESYGHDSQYRSGGKPRRK